MDYYFTLCVKINENKKITHVIYFSLIDNKKHENNFLELLSK